MLLLSGIIKHTCEGYKGSVLIEPEQAIEKADYKCGKSFYLDPILGTYKKEIIEDPIVDKILEMIQKAKTDKIDFGLKKITNNHSHVVFTNEDKYQNHKPDPDSKTKILYSQKLFQCMAIWLGLDIINCHTTYPISQGGFLVFTTKMHTRVNNRLGVKRYT